MPFFIVNAFNGQALAAYNDMPQAEVTARTAMMRTRTPLKLVIADSKGRILKIFSQTPFVGGAMHPSRRFFENFTDNLIASNRLNKALHGKKLRPREYRDE